MTDKGTDRIHTVSRCMRSFADWCYWWLCGQRACFRQDCRPRPVRPSVCMAFVDGADLVAESFDNPRSCSPLCSAVLVTVSDSTVLGVS